MRSAINHRQYGKCIKEILISTFVDKKIRLSFLLSTIVLTLGVLSNLAMPLILKRIVDSFSFSNPTLITAVLLSYCFIWIVSQVSVHTRTMLIYKIEQRLTFVLGSKVLFHIFDLSLNYFLNQQPGAVTNIIRRAQQNVPHIVLGVFFHALPTIIEFLFVIVLISYFYPLMYSLLMVTIFGIFFTYTLMVLKGAQKAREQANEADKDADGIVTDWISNYEAVKVFGKSRLALFACETELKKRENAEVKFMRNVSFFYIGQSFILGIGLSVFMYLVGQGVLHGSLTIGDFILFNGYILQFVMPVAILGQVVQEIKKTILDMKGVIDVLLTPAEIVEVSHPLHLSKSTPSITFENVSFKYKDRFILKDISFKIDAGHTAVIVGSTGVGKSTIAKLLLRLFDPIEGNIFINNTNLKQLSLKAVSETIGWIPQETYLLNDTIRNNLIFVHPEASSQEINEALEHAHLLEFINKLPQGLETIVGNRGLKLSGGEKQRLSLARLFLKKPKICIFDESTAFLDRTTELIIQDNIKKYLFDRTKVIITHRPFMINEADKIIALDNLVAQKQLAAQANISLSSVCL
ncbi:MAG: ABC transporter ATP-binding protein/permease [Alphaproteobacteria bacterium]|nr:ABC transporter ATP-binding protein/permease [Alphaproteobacteria bacterium]